jgi:hypothetical protein
VQGLCNPSAKTTTGRHAIQQITLRQQLFTQASVAFVRKNKMATEGGRDAALFSPLEWPVPLVSTPTQGGQAVSSVSEFRTAGIRDLADDRRCDRGSNADRGHAARFRTGDRMVALSTKGMARATRKQSSWRQRLFRRWLYLAMPWLAGVAGLSIYDHQRAIWRMAEAAQGDGVLPATAAWTLAAARYAGEAVLFYGVLPAALTFVLYVLLLPLADGWAARGDLDA